MQDMEVITTHLLQKINIQLSLKFAVFKENALKQLDSCEKIAPYKTSITPK